LIVAYLSRASRDTRQGLDFLDQVTRAGGAVYAPNLPDYTTADGRMLTTIQLAVDTGYRERKREEFERAKAGAIARGIPVNSRAAVGYRKGKDRRLVPDERVAPLVREAFEMRARGDGPVAIAAFLEEHRVRTSQGSRTWSKPAVYGLLSNRVYLGEIAYGRDRRYVNAEAHEPLVDLALWQAAQHPNGKRLARTREGTYLLAGIARCASCGYCLQGTVTSRGKRVYRCKRRHASGVCEAPAYVPAPHLDEVIVGAFWTHTQDLEAEGSTDVAGKLARLEGELERAEQALRDFLSPAMQEAIGDTAEYAAAARERREARDRAAAELGQARAETPHTIPSETLREAWERMTTPERRELLGLRFDCVAVRRDRSSIIYHRGTAPASLPRRGFRREPQLVPFPDPPVGAGALAP
jgi:site-specific DNA recombinase